MRRARVEDATLKALLDDDVNGAGEIMRYEIGGVRSDNSPAEGATEYYNGAYVGTYYLFLPLVSGVETG